MFRLIISGIGFLLIITFSVVICEDLLLQTVASSSLKPSTSTTELSPFSLSANTCLECETSVQKALAWLVSQREPDYGWRNDTPKVITTLQLIQSNDDLKGLLPSSVEMQLSSKQMEVEIVVLLWRHHEIPVTPPKLAQYSLALSALCEDPRQFHGHDLIGTLQHHESTHDLDFAYASLAVCSAKAHLRKKQIRRLLDIASNAKDHNIDTLAMTILALRCIVRDHRHRNLQHSLKRPGMSLARQQLPDGSFGNLYNTALTILALQDAPEANNYWNKSAAIGYIESKQDPDGAFTDPGLTAEVILALSSKGLSAIRGFDCGKIDQEDENHVEYDGLTKNQQYHGNDSDARNVTITYTLWVGTNITENYTISLVAPRNSSFYSVMQMAMEADPRFAFEASEWPNGHYVHTLAGFKEEPMGYHYWLLYRLPEVPDPLVPPANHMVAPVGVDDLLIEEGDHFLFWYKKL
ncbi:uncharacterized protein CG3556 [Onthophagus taurus]|uniref:uncharacterized protein CG3556 n=1 Tax=Onthophagus taurus TaxID=166361 RepID=UPI000C2026CA|nr:uncharacterized protein CG3556 [Onthophagus taurus]